MEVFLNYLEGVILKFFMTLKTIYWENLDVVLISFLISLIMAISVLIVEVWYQGFSKSGLRRLLFDRSKSTVIDIAYFILHTTNLVLVLAVLMSLGVPYALSGVLKNLIQLDLDMRLPMFAQLCLYLLFADFMGYWQHRLMHENRTLWKIHEFHHSAEEFNTITVFREHPLDKSLNALFMTFPAIVLGVPVGEYPLFITLYGVIGYVKHSSIPWHGFLGKWVVQSPRDHWIHHSKKTVHHDANYANNFPIWDHIFGTYYHGNDLDAELGLYENPYNKSLPLRDTIMVEERLFKSFLRALWRRGHHK